MAVLGTSVSFLEDQAIGGDLGLGARTWYYERINPSPGRPWNRYNLAYIPFVETLTSPGWLTATQLGRGPDFLPLHLLQVRRQVGGGDSIPLWLVWLVPAISLVVALVAGWLLVRAYV
jgi:hypothetical protein